MKKQQELTQAQKKWLAGLGIAAFLLLMAWVCWYAGWPLIRFVREPERFRAWVDSRGPAAPALFIGMVALQVVVAIIPGEPLEIAAGYAFGAVEGTVLCLAGTFLGSMAVFLLVRRFGTRAVEIFIPLEELRPLRFLQKSERRLRLWVFFIFFLPGTPKDLLCYFAGLTDLSWGKWLLLCSVGRLPSILTSTIGGSALGVQDYQFAILVFAGTLLLSGAGLLLYRGLCRRHEKEKEA